MCAWRIANELKESEEKGNNSLSKQNPETKTDKETKNYEAIILLVKPICFRVRKCKLKKTYTICLFYYFITVTYRVASDPLVTKNYTTYPA